MQRLWRNCLLFNLIYDCNITAPWQGREEAAARAVLEAAKKAGAAGELLSARELQAIAQQALNPPKEAAPAARVSLSVCVRFA